MDPLHSQHYHRIKSCFPFFSTTLILPLISRSWLGSTVSFSPRSPRQPVWLLFSLTPLQTLDDRGRGRIFISFTFRFSGPSDSLINSQIMRLNVSSPHLDWFMFFIFWFECLIVALARRLWWPARSRLAVRAAIQSKHLSGWTPSFCSFIRNHF